MRHSKKLTLLLVIVPLAFTSGHEKNLPIPREYEVLPIPLPDGYDSSEARAINEKGHVVGSCRNSATGVDYTFHWELSAQTRILYSGMAHDLNDLGQVEGQIGSSPPLGYTYLIDKATPARRERVSHQWHFRANNNLGQTAGAVYEKIENETRWRPYVWSASGEATLVLSRDLYSGIANDVNDRGQVVGFVRPFAQGAGYTAFIWDPVEGMRLLGTLGGNESDAQKVNNKSVVVGFSTLQSGYAHAFVWSSTKGILDLGSLGHFESYAMGSNDNNQIVGHSVLGSERELRATLWEGGRIYDLNGALSNSDEFELLTHAYDINNRGQIVGAGEIDGQKRAFLMTPIEPGLKPGD